MREREREREREKLFVCLCSRQIPLACCLMISCDDSVTVCVYYPLVTICDESCLLVKLQHHVLQYANSLGLASPIQHVQCSPCQEYSEN